VTFSRRALADISGPSDRRIADSAERSPLRAEPGVSELADLDELDFRENIEPYESGLEAALGFIRRKRLLEYLDHALDRTGVVPSGVVVELGAGSCWLSAALACLDEVDRVVAVDFSRRRLTTIAPASIALLEAPPAKIERRIADYYATGLDPESADLVVMDAAFHHASDPARLARVVFDLLRPGGTLLLLREPTLTSLRRSRDHGLEGQHGNFEHEYHEGEYLAFLRSAGFDASRVAVRSSYPSRWRRTLYRGPLALLIAELRGSYVYVARKPSL